MTSTKELRRLFLFLLIGAFVGLIINAFGWALFIALAGWTVIQAIQFNRLNAWAKRPLGKPPRITYGWFNTVMNPYKLIRRERNRAANAITGAKEVFGLIELMPDAVILIGSNGLIEAFNPAAERLLNLAPTDRGLSLASVVRAPDFVNFIGSEVDQILEFPSPVLTGKTLEAHKFALEGERIIVLVRDVTELNRLLTMRQSFVANVSHELRTPLTVVLGYLEAMRDDIDDDMKLALLPRLDSPMNRIHSLVDELLVLTRLESTPIKIDQDPISVRRVITNAVAEVQGLCQTPNQIRVTDTCEDLVRGAETELHSVCTNLLSNALRYSEDGTPVEIRCTNFAGKTRVSVTDYGTGIAPEHLSRITERFYRIENSAGTSRAGTGLGLAIVKHALLRHDSELQVESHLGEGSTFFFDLLNASEAAQDA